MNTLTIPAPLYQTVTIRADDPRVERIGGGVAYAVSEQARTQLVTELVSWGVRAAATYVRVA